MSDQLRVATLAGLFTAAAITTALIAVAWGRFLDGIAGI